MAVEIDHACPSRARRPAGCPAAAGPLVLEGRAGKKREPPRNGTIISNPRISDGERLSFEIPGSQAESLRPSEPPCPSPMRIRQPSRRGNSGFTARPKTPAAPPRAAGAPTPRLQSRDADSAAAADRGRCATRSSHRPALSTSGHGRPSARGRRSAGHLQGGGSRPAICKGAALSARGRG